MSFHDLAEGWQDAPLTDENRCDVVDLMLSIEDRVDGSILVLLLSAEGRVLQPIVTDDLSSQPLALSEGLRNLAIALDAFAGRVLIARGRAGSSFINSDDQQVATIALQVFGDRLSACYLATPHRIVAIPAMTSELELSS